MQPAPAHPKAFSPALLAGILAACGLLAWLLVPGDRTLLERQLRDGAFQNASQTLARIRPSERAKDPAFYLLAELEIARRQSAIREPARRIALIQRCADALIQFPDQPEFLRQLLLLIAGAPAADAVLTALEPALPRFAPAARMQTYQALTALALASNQPQFAATIHSNLWRSTPEDRTLTLEMARLWRQAARPDLALSTLDVHRGQSPRGAPTSPEIARLRITLLREAGRVGEALDEALLAYPNIAPAEREAFAELLTALARECSRTRDVLPLARERAERDATRLQPWLDLARLAIESGATALAISALEQAQTLAPTNTATLLELAQYHEWNGEPQRAFDAYTNALRHGAVNALEPLLRLNNGLYRDEDLLAAVSSVEDQGLLERHRLALARVHAKAADFDRANRLYDRELATRTNDVELLREVGQLALDLQDFDRADRLLSQAARDKPTDLGLLTALAEAKFRRQEYTAAMNLFWEVARTSGDAAAFEHYITLATSLGDLERAAQALEQRLRNPSTATSRDYEQLAYLASVTGNTDRHKSALLAGLRQFPDDQSLRLQATYTFSDRGDFMQAAHILADHPGLRDSLDLSRFHLGLLIQAQAITQALHFAEQSLSPKFRTEPAILELLAQLYDSTGRHTEAVASYQKLLKTAPDSPRLKLNCARNLAALGRWKEAEALLKPMLVQPTPEVLSLAAQTYSTAGRHRDAELYQRRYLETHPPDASAAWAFLGDILLARGDAAAARRAYRHALDLKLQSLTSSSRPK